MRFIWKESQSKELHGMRKRFNDCTTAAGDSQILSSSFIINIKERTIYLNIYHRDRLSFSTPSL